MAVGQSIDKLYVTIGADIKELSKGMSKAAAVMQREGRKLQQVGAELSLAISAPLALLGGATVKAAGDFEAAINRVAAVSGASADELKQLSNVAKELGATTAFSASEAASGLEYLAMAGFTASNAIKALPGTLALAASGGIELGRAADIASNVLSQFRLNAEQTDRVVDVMAKTITSSNTNMEQMAEAMNYLGPTAAAMGASIEEASAVIGILANNGLQGGLGTRALGSALIRLAAPTAKAKQVMEEYNLEFFDAQGNFIGLAKTIGELQRGLAGLTQQQQQGALATLFGVEAMQELNILMSTGEQAITDYSNSLSNSFGTANRIAETRMKGFNGAMKELESAIEALQIAFAESGILDFLTEMVKDLAGAVREMKNLDPAIFRFVAALGAIGVALPPIIAAVGTLAVGIGALGGPITAVVAGVSALVAGFVAFSGSSRDVTKAFEDQRSKVSQLESELPGLLQRYEELKDTKAKDEQEELAKVIQRIGEMVPTAVTEFDRYGKAISVSTEEAKEFIKAQQAILRAKNRDAIKAETDQLNKYRVELYKVQQQLSQGGVTIRDNIGGSSFVANFSEDERAEALKRKAVLEGLIGDSQKYIESLKGENIAVNESAKASGAAAEGTQTNADAIQAAIPIVEKYKIKMEELKASLDRVLEGDEATFTKIAGELNALEAEFNNLLNPEKKSKGIPLNLDFNPDTIVDEAKVIAQAFEEELSEQINKEIAGLDVGGITTTVNTDGSNTGGLAESLRVAAEQAKAFNAAFGEGGESPAAAQVRAINDEINRLIGEEGLDAASEKVQSLVAEIKKLNGPAEQINQAFLKIGKSMKDAFVEGEEGIESYGRALLNGIRKAVKALIAEGVAKVVANALGSVPYPLNIAVASAAGAGAAALFNTIVPKFSKGIENFSGGLAKVHSGEVLANLAPGTDVIPAHRARNMFNSGGGNSELVAKISGNDLLVLLRRTEESNSMLF